MGHIWKLGDNINTDIIIPGRYNVTTDRAQLAKYCLYEVLPEFAQQVKPGDIVVGGHNFGCGSSREHAPTAILANNVKVVIARSFARIFYRNAVNIGLPVLVCEEAVLNSEDGQELDVNLEKGTIHNITTGQTFQSEPLDPFVARIVGACWRNYQLYRAGRNIAMRSRELQSPLTVCVIAGDDAAPEVMRPTVEILRTLAPDIRFLAEPPCGRDAQALYGTAFPDQTREAIDAADCTLFGASGGPCRRILWYTTLEQRNLYQCTPNPLVTGLSQSNA